MRGKKRDWRKAQPHHAGNGKFVRRSFAAKHPGKVVWVKAKKR